MDLLVGYYGNGKLDKKSKQNKRIEARLQYRTLASISLIAVGKSKKGRNYIPL